MWRWPVTYPTTIDWASAMSLSGNLKVGSHACALVGALKAVTKITYVRSLFMGANA
jgi:hypothetical protein